MKRRLNMLTLLLLLLLSLCVNSCKLASLKRVRVAPGPVNVRVEVAMESSSICQRDYVGTVEPARMAVLSSLHSGTLKTLDVRQGQKVRKGQSLAYVHSQNVESLYSSSLATLVQAEDGYARARTMLASGGVSQLQMVEVQTKLDQARSSFEAAQASKADCHIKAPFDGEVAKTMVNVGEKVTIGQAVISIIDPAGLEVVISVPENDISSVREGDRAVVIFTSLDNFTTRARVKYRDMVSDPMSHTYRCSLTLSSCPSELMSGMACKVQMETDNAKGIVVPASIVKLDSEGKYLWLVRDGKAEKVRIKCNGYSGKGVIVSSGLEVGDLIITEGASKVSSGMTVNISE